MSPGETRTFSLTFRPAAAGVVTGHVAVHGEPSKPLAVVELHGNGTAPTPALSASPAHLELGEVVVGTFSARSVTLANASAEPLTISAVTTAGSGVSASGIDVPATVAPGASTTLSVRLTPTDVGPVSGSVSVLAAGRPEPLAAVTAAGMGVLAPAIITDVAVRDATVEASRSVQLVADVIASGAIDTSVTWAVESGSLGSIDPATGTYTAPAAAGTYRISAASNADPSKKGIGVVTVTPAQGWIADVVYVTVSPATASLAPGATRAFAATVTGTANAGVWWGVQEGASGGVITPAGVYTAPWTPGTYHVVTRSQADSTKTAVATVTVTAPAPAVSVAVSPTAASLAAGGTRTFAATVTGSTNTAVTWSVQEGAMGGSVTAAGLYTAPATAGTYHVVAKSVADATKIATATVTVTAPAPAAVTVAVSPTTASLATGGTRTFAATVTGSTNTSVTWSVQEGAAGGSITAAGVYTAPTTPGTYHVVAKSAADATKVAAATVTVTASGGPAAALPPRLAAFPGCQGAGCYTRGGFTTSAGTPRIYRVTSLSSGTGAGTLGACIAASGPRVCTFAVAGTIHAPSTGYIVKNPYITIRGDTAPGQGIAIDFDGTTGAATSDVLRITTHDVVVRGLRFRHGNGYASGGAGDPVRIEPTSTAAAGAVNNIVVDHVSAHWGSDQTFSISSSSGMPAGNYPRDITLSYSIVGEGLSSYPSGAGSKCAMAIAWSATSAKAMVNLDWHHNFFGNCTRRFPEIRTDGSARLVNNILYNWGNDRQSFQSGIHGDLIGNLGRKGPNTANGSMFWLGYDPGVWTQSRRQSVHMSGNKYLGGPVQGWGTGIVSESSSNPFGAPERRATPLAPAASGPAIVAESADALPTTVAGLGGAGHSRRLDCGGAWVTSGVRDSVDTRLLREFQSPPAQYPGGVKTGCTGTACFPASVAETPTGGYPVLASVASSTVCSAASRDNTSCACADGDADGMPDYWERALCGAASGTGSCSALGSTVAPPWTDLEAFQSGSVVAP
jgi:hypothetical protein